MNTHRDRDTVAVVGATGYTGKRIVRELLSAGHRVTCVGRDREKLARLAASVERPVQIEVAELDDRERLERVCREVDVVVNAAGSFVNTCEPVARAAIGAGSHYVDISGEQRSVRHVFDELHRPAMDAEVALVPSSAFYAALADLLIAVMADGADHIGTIDIAYDITDWTPSGAAYDNILRGLGQPIVQYDHGFVDVSTSAHRAVDFGAPIGVRTVLTYPAPEVLTIPRHLEVDQIRTSMSASTFGTVVPVRFTSMVSKAVGRGLTSRVGPLVEKVVSASSGARRTRIDDDPTEFRIVATTATGPIVTTATLSGPGIFDITAPIAAMVTDAVLAESFASIGALSPAQVVEPRALLDALAVHGLTYEVTATHPQEDDPR